MLSESEWRRLEQAIERAVCSALRTHAQHLEDKERDAMIRRMHAYMDLKEVGVISDDE